MNIEVIYSNKGNAISGLQIFQPKVFGDRRGSFYESWNKDVFNRLIGREINFLQDNHSNSNKGVIRGLHYQLDPMAQGKLIRCVLGEIFDVAIDLRKNSTTFGEWASINLSEENEKQFWIPEGFAHGFLTLSKTAKVLYKTTNYWEKDLERIINWNDLKLSIDWPLKSINYPSPQLSIKDQNGISFDEAINNSEIF